MESKDDTDFDEFVFIEELSLEFAYAQSGTLTLFFVINVVSLRSADTDLRFG